MPRAAHTMPPTRSESDPDFYATGGWHYGDRESGGAKLRARYLPYLPAEGRILDAGCGDGWWTTMLADEGFDMVGLDHSTDAIEKARTIEASEEAPIPSYHHSASTASRRIAGVEPAESQSRSQMIPHYVLGDARDRLTMLGMFDAVFCRAISPTGNPTTSLARQVFANLAAVLNPGGVFLLIRATDGSGDEGTGIFGGPRSNPRVSDLVALLEPHARIVTVDVRDGEAVISARKS